MGIFDKAGDLLVKKLTNKETVRLPYDKLTEIVNEEFIMGADDEFLDKVLKTAKGGFFKFSERQLESASERYTLKVGSWNDEIPLGKVTYVIDNVENKFYQLDKDSRWKKFYKSVEAAVQMEKINRTR